MEIKVIRIGLLGDSAVGKTAICNSFLGCEYQVDSIPTIGCEKFEKKLNYKMAKK